MRCYTKRLHLCKNTAVVFIDKVAETNQTEHGSTHQKYTVFLVVLYCYLSPQYVHSHSIHHWKRAEIIPPLHITTIILISCGNWFAIVGCFRIAKHMLTYSSTFLMQRFWFYSAILFAPLCCVPVKIFTSSYLMSTLENTPAMPWTPMKCLNSVAQKSVVQILSINNLSMSHDWVF